MPNRNRRRTFFHDGGPCDRTTQATACRMEHAIDPKTVERLVCFIEYIHTCPRAGDEWLKSFTRFCRPDPKKAPECTACIRDLKISAKVKRPVGC